MYTELKSQLGKEDEVFWKRLQIFFNLFVREKGKLYLNKNEAFYTFKQLVVKEIYVNRSRTLYSPIAVVKLAII